MRGSEKMGLAKHGSDWLRVDSARPESAGRSSSEKHTYDFQVLSLSLSFCLSFTFGDRQLSILRVAKGPYLDAQGLSNATMSVISCLIQIGLPARRACEITPSRPWMGFLSFDNPQCLPRNLLSTTLPSEDSVLVDLAHPSRQ
jgi:hypothetical protein